LTVDVKQLVPATVHSVRYTYSEKDGMCAQPNLSDAVRIMFVLE